MIELKYLLERLRPYLLEAPVRPDGILCPERVEILDGQETLSADRLYIGETIPKTAAAEPGTVVMLTSRERCGVPGGTTVVRLSCTVPVLYNTVSSAVYDAMEIRRAELETVGGSFYRCWEEIMERRITGAAEIREALSRTQHPADLFVRVALVTFAEDISCPPYPEVIVQLGKLFPDANITVWRNEIIMLLSYPERSFRNEVPEEELGPLLERYGAYCAVGNGTRNLSAIPILYNLTRQCLAFARQLDLEKGRRIFYFEGYANYCVIDMCAQRFIELHRNNDIIYLVHPAVIHLTRYDRSHNTNLRDVLFYYLRNERNLIKTAADTYMHRNTVINKVNRITELTGLDFEDSRLRQRLIFSCQVVIYYEKVMKLELRL
ncbi:MAG: helix-turn-helix domain-containing protein [Oscillospiraceae bacterium]|nr:helix-turn-helix domain-containing protein [Oscillospiraceae bacterium]